MCPGAVWRGGVHLALEVCESGAPVLQRYGVSDDDAFADTSGRIHQLIHS